MSLATKIAEKAKEAMKNDAVIITGANFLETGLINKLQIYFWDETDVAMDTIKRIDLLESCPENIYIININAKNEKELLQELFLVEIDDELYYKLENSDMSKTTDDLGPIIDISYLESVEEISKLKD